MKKINIFLLTLAFSAPALAQDWTGAVSSDWNNTANWSSTPSNGDDIVIDPANYTGAMAQPILTGASSFTPAEMLIQNGAVLTISGYLNASDRVEVLGGGTMVLLTSGTFALNGGGNNARLIFAEEAHLQMNGGSLNVGQRLLFELGATGKVNDGTVVVGETIALVDGSVNGSSRLIQNGGTITTNEEFGFENEAGEFYPEFEQNGGEIHINGALAWLGASPGSGRGFFRSYGGTVYVTGSIGNDPTSTMGMYLEISGDGAVLENTGNSVQTQAGDSIILSDGGTWMDNSTTSWINNGVFYSEDGLFKSGNTTLNGGGSYQFDGLSIPSGFAMNHVSPASIFVGGTLMMNGSFNHNSNKLVMNGSINQAITGMPTSTLNLYELEIKNSADQVTIDNPVNIAHHLQLTDGLVALSINSTIKLADDATVTGGSDTTFVSGYMEKAGNDAIEFPVGMAPDRYRPLSISAPATLSTVVRVAYTNIPYTQLTPVEAPMLSVSAIEYWNLTRTGSSDLFSVTAGWNNATQSGLTDCNDISLAAWNGTTWKFIPSTATGLCSGNNAGTLASNIQLPAVGPITFGFMENVYQNVLTICPGESVTVGTNTYTESGNYIDILEGSNGDDSTVVTVLTVMEPLSVAVINNTTFLIAAAPWATHFQWIDCNNGNAIIPGATESNFSPEVNGSYAVIVTRDDCDDTDTSACAIINQLGLETPGIPDLSIYPNPVSSKGKLTVSASSDIQAVEIRTLEGRLVETPIVSKEGNVFVVELPSLASGTYLVRLTDLKGGSMSKRLVIGN